MPGGEQMGSYPVPGDWFENIAEPSHDEDFSYPDEYYDDGDGEFGDEFDAVARPSGELRHLDGVDPRPAHRYQRAEIDPLSDAVQQLRRLASRLKAEHHPMAHVPQQIANSLVNVRAPVPSPPSHPVPGAEADFAPSPTGNCERCGRALPLPTMKRGRPRTLCEFCSPRRAD